MDGYVALGSNLGDRTALLRAGLAGMAGAGLELVAVSSVWATAAVGFAGAPPFLNMAVKLATDRPPREVLEALLAIERSCGRRRSEPNAPRTLDLDLLLLGDLELAEPGLCLPHPRMWERAFVLEPLREIAPGLRNPRTGRSVEQELARLPRGTARRLGRIASADHLPL